MNHYENHVDLFSSPVTPDTVRGATPAPGWIILHAIPKPDESTRGGIFVPHQATKNVTPLVYRVLSVGAGVSYQPGDLLLVSFLAGDKLSAEIVLAHQDDILLKWGEGLKR